jgi:hypothetical protein
MRSVSTGDYGSSNLSRRSTFAAEVYGAPAVLYSASLLIRAWAGFESQRQHQGSLAQLEEHGPHKAEVHGSRP